MNHAPSPARADRCSARATWAALGRPRQPRQLFGPVRAPGPMAPQPVPQTPLQTWSEALSAIVAGAHGRVDITPRRRAAPGVPAAWGRQACAEPSVVPATRDACPAPQVAPRPQAMARSSRRHRRGDRHDDTRRVQVVAAEMTGRPCGTNAAVASPGSVAQPRGRGRATREDDLVVARLGPGTTPLTTALPPVGLATAQPLAREEETRRRTRWRMEAGGGRVAAGNGRRGRGSQGPGQDAAGTRAPSLAARVTAWGADPRLAAPQVGGVPVGAPPDRRPVRRVAGRGRTPHGPSGVGGVLSPRTPPQVSALTRPPVARVHDPTAVLWA
jgi:hypothetical protein